MCLPTGPSVRSFITRWPLRPQILPLLASWVCHRRAAGGLHTGVSGGERPNRLPWTLPTAGVVRGRAVGRGYPASHRAQIGAELPAVMHSVKPEPPHDLADSAGALA